MYLSGLLKTSSVILLLTAFQINSQYIDHSATPVLQVSGSFTENISVPDISAKLFDKDFSATTVLIIESRSFNPGHVMDTNWKAAAQGMGMTASIALQTALDDTAFFASTDVLIISSGVIDLPANRVNTIKAFMMRGKNVYFQCEYLSTYTSNQGFASIVNSTGGVFNWGSTQSGDLQPMQILGALSTTPNNVPSIGYFWYGVYGTGNTTIEYYMRYNGNNYGFIYRPVNTAYGKIIANSDQDWVRAMTSISLMQNTLYSLSTFTGIEPISSEIPDKFSLSQNYPNPFNPVTSFRFQVPGLSSVKIKVFDNLGREIETLVNEQLQSGTYEVTWNASNYPSGVYFYTILTHDYQETKKMVLIR